MLDKKHKIVIAGDFWGYKFLKPYEKEDLMEAIPFIEYCYISGGSANIASLLSASLDHQVYFHNSSDDNIKYVCTYLKTIENNNTNLITQDKPFGLVKEPSQNILKDLCLENCQEADVVIIYDTDYGFSNDENLWPDAIKNNFTKPYIIYVMKENLFKSKLCHYIYKHHGSKNMGDNYGIK